MKKSMFIRGFTALAAFALVLSVVGSSKNPVERPFKAAGVISFTPTSASSGTFGVVGNGTHLGRFVGNGTYQVTSVSPDGLKIYMHVAATWTAANGDTIELDMPDWVSDNSVTSPTSSGVANIIGGTGRFAGASGSMFGEISPAHGAPGVTQIISVEGNIAY